MPSLILDNIISGAVVSNITFLVALVARCPVALEKIPTAVSLLAPSLNLTVALKLLPSITAISSSILISVIGPMIVPVTSTAA